MKSLSKFALTAAAALAIAGCASTTPSVPIASSARPVVLVHGAWMGASAWDAVAADLRSQGIKVTAVELPGHGNDTTPADKLSLTGYVDAVLAALPADGSKVTLVGHSMGGMVISAVAEKQPQRFANLVYVAGYLPQNGESLYKISQRDKDSRVGKYWTQADPKNFSPATIKAEGIVDVFCADCSAADQQMLIKTHRAEAVPPLGTPVTLSAANFGSVPRIYVHTKKDNAVSYGLQKDMLQAAGGAAQVHELDTSHAPMLTQPQALARIVAKAAQ